MPTPDVAQQRLHPRRRQHRVVDVVVGGGGQPAVALRPRLPVGVVEDHELEFGGRDGDHVPLGEPVELRAQDAARRRDHRAAVVPAEVGHHQRGAGQPRDAAQRGEVRRHHHVAVAGLPARHGVSVDGVHVDVDGQQVVAAFGAVRGDVVDEQPRRDPFAGQPALHVGEGDDHGVDVARGDQLLELGSESMPGSRGRQSRPSLRPTCRSQPLDTVSPGIPRTDLHNCHSQR